VEAIERRRQCDLEAIVPIITTNSNNSEEEERHLDRRPVVKTLWIALAVRAMCDMIGAQRNENTSVHFKCVF
jgi:hypothetical protein